MGDVNVVTRREFVKLCISTVFATGLSELLEDLSTTSEAAYREIPVLLYHRIGYTNGYLTITPEKFAADMQILTDYGYHTISLALFEKFLIDGNVELPERPLLITFDDGYADNYDLFTPDLGELAFLADEKAPHPFYTRGFLLAEEEDIPGLLERARRHGNCPPNLIVKGRADHIVCDGEIRATVTTPSVAAMECIGGTGDLVTGLVTAFLAGGLPLCRAALSAARAARLLARHCAPTPATQVGELIARLPEVLRVESTVIFAPSA